MTNSNKLAAAAAAALALAFAGTAVAQQAGAKPAAGAQVKQQGPEEVFNRWDKDKNKSLSLEEFRAGFGEVQAANAVRKLHQNFTQMDVNKSGALEQNEYANLELIKKAGSKAPMMSAYDADKNGKMEFKEYVSMIQTMMRNK